MMRRNLYSSFLTLAGVLVLAIGGLGQGKGHGGGNPHGGGGDHGGGDGKGHGHEKQWDGGGDHGNRGNGNGNGWGRRGDDGQARQQREVQQQQQWQQRAVQQQQRQNEWNARRQQQDAIRQQQEAYREQQRQQYQAQRQYQQPTWQGNDDRGRGRGHGKKNGWTDDGPRGNAYGLRGVWPGEFRGWRDPDKHARKAERDMNRAPSYNPYAYDPYTNWNQQRAYRQQYQRPYQQQYQQPNYGYQYYSTPQYYGYNNGYSAPNYYYPSTSGHSTRDAIVRTVLSTFFGGGGNDQYYGDNSYYQQPVYSPYYGYVDPYQASYNNLGYSYYPAGYSYSAQPYYQSNYFDPGYAQQPMLGTGLFGGGGLKSTLLNVGLSMLQGFMGQGYEDGIYAGQYARRSGINDFYDPYTYDNAAYYSPYVSSLGTERQAFDEGYRLGYADAMRNRDPYGTLRSGNTGMDLVTEFLSSGLLG